MTRHASLWLPVLTAGALSALFFGCGGEDQGGLFSPAGVATGEAGASIGSSGSNASAGRSSSSGGSASAAGASALGGNGSGAMAGAGGPSGTAGSSSHGGNGSAGSSAGGNSNGGANNGGSGGMSAGASSGGANNAGASNGGSGGASNGGSSGASGGAGASNGGTSNGGTSNGGTSNGGTSNGGGGGAPTCQDLLTTAADQLDAARACDNSGNVVQCTGEVNTTCGCEVPVESNDSAETKAYLATLAQIQEQHCVQACPALACVVAAHAQCKSQGGSGSMCVAAPLTPIN